MYVIMGASGHVGSNVAKTLLARGEAVAAVVRDPQQAHELADRGAEIVVVDVKDRDGLRAAFRRGRRAFVLNPPADTAGDTDSIERSTVAAILSALEGSHLEKIVVESTYGAQPGDRIGDLSTLFELEEGVRRQFIPSAINRAAYYYSNWDPLVEVARRTGQLPTFFPTEMQIPMVAPSDLGVAAADRLTSGLDDIGLRYVEGPRRYSSGDVATALTQALARAVTPAVTPRDRWEAAYRQLGFSEAAAHAYTRMTAVTVDAYANHDSGIPDDPWRGPTTLQAYLAAVAGATPQR